MKREIIHIPPEHLPSIDELPGDLVLLARGIEAYRPGQGVAMALFLSQVFAGIGVYIRNADDFFRRIRDRAIRRDYDAGARVKELALKNRLSTRRIEQILAEPPSPAESADRQLKLF
ncbi:Mor transcription activator family protein [Desulfofustis glycolicus]|uniref:Mor transcription activator family protein n=1 Tax=Desulfofustis glycolicus DSM 9705 TaxID=1121409 RepID=A0A1M5S655_9BACT|nr:Mor transcription activator family protein [Desulfofustis glycolicus]SHH33758.1 Mor transcription activator family protein [Desulfofustis glycolicus DSM 9705]